MCRALPTLSEKPCLPTASALFACPRGMIFRKGAVEGYVPTTDSVSSFSIPVTASLPPLEWPLSHQSGSYELRIEVQPKPHHRAHYETEGSRGAVKAPTGGHPVVQVRAPILLFCVPRLLLGDSPRLSPCLWLVRLRDGTQPFAPLRDGGVKVELGSGANPATEKPEKKVVLGWMRTEVIRMLKQLLPFLSDEKLPEFCRQSCTDRRFLQPSSCI